MADLLDDFEDEDVILHRRCGKARRRGAHIHRHEPLSGHSLLSHFPGRLQGESLVLGDPTPAPALALWLDPVGAFPFELEIELA